MTVRILIGDARARLSELPDQSVNCVVTSPPYFGLRDYGVDGQIGLEATPDAYVGELVSVFREVRRVLRDDGTVWLNLGDSYAGGGGHSPNAPSSAYSKSGLYGEALKSGGIKPQGIIKAKDLIGIPWRVAFALQADGWFLRQDIIWAKPNPMPESVRDRCTKAHEYVFLLSKRERYFYDADAISEPAVYGGQQLGIVRGDKRRANAMGVMPTGNERPGADATSPKDRNRRSVWTIASEPFPDAHFATFPPALIEPCILAGCPKGGTVIDPFGGSGTTALVADRLGRNAILIELNPTYAAMAERRLSNDAGMFASVLAEHLEAAE
jgi:DNA modification methylase